MLTVQNSNFMQVQKLVKKETFFFLTKNLQLYLPLISTRMDRKKVCLFICGLQKMDVSICRLDIWDKKVG